MNHLPPIPAPDPVILTRGLRKTFRDFWRRPQVEAVRGLDLRVECGEVKIGEEN